MARLQLGDRRGEGLANEIPRLQERSGRLIGAEFWFSSPFRGQLDGDPAAAQVDHRDHRGS
jgi:hypothetical protein